MLLPLGDDRSNSSHGLHTEQTLNILISEISKELEADASAANPSSPRCFDDRMLARIADAIAALGRRGSGLACL